MPRVTVLSATPAALPPVTDALGAIPGIDLVHLLDEGLLRLVLDAGEITPACVQRFVAQLATAAASSDAVVVTCNVYSNVLAAVRPAFGSAPILAIDEPMVRAAVTRARRIAVVATGAAGLRSQTELITGTARALGREVEIVPVLREAAFAALIAGDGETHDAIVRAALAELDGVDLAVLAQASMARALAPTQGSEHAIPAPVPVLSSPGMAADELRRILAV